MASYEVFEDRENDSASAYDNLKENSKPSQLLQKRAVLGVLQQNTAKFTFRSSNTQVTQEVRVEKVIQDENALSRRLAAARSKAAPTIPVAQFKAFSVYEDDTENTDSCVYKPPNDLCPDVVKAPENVSTTRTPLAEITESVLESPACSTDTKNSSHMSVDRTLIKTPYKAYPEFRENCSDAERFYELIEYRQDIYEYLRRTETRHRPKPGYMRKQPDITSSMRTVLVDWLVEVCGEYRMHQESLMLAVNYVDRFLSHMSVVRTKLQLVGTAAMFIASKYEEIYPPDVGEFVYITDDTYNKKQVLRMEHLILKVLKFDLSIPTVGAFLGCYCITWNLTVETRSLAMYLAELSMLEDEPYMKYLPSHLAAGCLALARYTLGHDPWLAHMHRASGYSFADLTECIGHLVRTHHNAARLPQQAIQEKYRTSKYQHVATIEPRALNLN